MKNGLLIATISLIVTICKAQSGYSSRPEIGKPFTDFVLDSVDNYSKKTLSYNDLKGKWMILDFWGEFCSGCIKKMPEISSFEKKFAGKVQVVLVTKTYANPGTAMKMFEKLRTKFNIKVPITYDQDFFNRVGPDGLPLLVVIDPKGIVRAITNSITETDVNKFIDGKVPALSNAYLLNEIKPSDTYNWDMPLLVKGNGGDERDYLYRSLLTKWRPSMICCNTIGRKNRFEIFKVDLKGLYRFAYFGFNSIVLADSETRNNYYFNPILELSDSSFFQSDENSGKNFFCYSLSFADSVFSENYIYKFKEQDRARFQKIMQNDLENNFGFACKIETRRMPYYKLIASDEAKKLLKTKGGSTTFDQLSGDKGLRATNIPISTLVAKIWGSSGFPFRTMIIQDETRITDNFDITIDAVYFDDWVKEIRKYGLDLVLGEKEMKVLVIRDRKNR